MRITLEIDSATAAEAEDFVRAWQISRPEGETASTGPQPTVRIMGIGWGVTLPAVHAERAAVIVNEIDWWH